MKYLVINSENYADIKKSMEAAKNDIMKRYALDSFDNYTTVYYAIIGQKAVEMFCREYGCKVSDASDAPKTDGKTRAKVLPCLYPEYYCDARDQREGMTKIYNGRVDGYYIIEFDGVLLTSYSYDRKGGAREFSLFNDVTDYRGFLPYNWENEHPRPNRVGVLTDRKLNDWKTWLLSRKAAAEAEKAKREGATAAFLAKVRAIDTTSCKDYRITDTRGYFVRNGLKYSYQISANGYISEEITVDYQGANNIEKFVKMAEGNF